MKVEEQKSNFGFQKIAIIRSHMVCPNASYQLQGKISLNLDINHTFDETSNLLSVFLSVATFDEGPEEDRLEIFITGEGTFSVPEVMAEEKLDFGFFSEVNAPAIMYPYLRQHVSNLSLQAGIKNAIMLPVVNFVRMRKFHQKKKEDSDSKS